MNTKEEWRYVDGTKEMYSVSSFGRVKSHFPANRRCLPDDVKNDPILKLANGTKGYKLVGITTSAGKRYSAKVHRLVAQAFIPNPHNYKTVNHLDGDKANNSVGNLEWASNAMNMWHASNVLHSKRGERSINSPLSNNNVYDIRALRVFGASVRSLALAFGIAERNILQIINRKSWTHI